MQDASSEKVQQVQNPVQQALGRIAALASILPSALAATSLATMAERLYRERRRRYDYFPTSLFGEPAWDLMLALFIAGEEGRPVSLAEAYRAAAVKPGAGRGLLDRMEKAGLVARSPAGKDRRRKYVALTPSASERLSNYLARLV